MFDGKLSIPEVIATLGVIGSLLFVGFEIRQSNAMARTEMLTQTAAGWIESTQSIAGNERMTELMYRSYSESFDEADGADRTAFFNMSLGLLKFYEIRFLQIRLGIIEENDVTWPPEESQFFATRMQRELWPNLSLWFDKDFARFWEQRFRLVETGS